MKQNLAIGFSLLLGGLAALDACSIDVSGGGTGGALGGADAGVGGSQGGFGGIGDKGTGGADAGRNVGTADGGKPSQTDGGAGASSAGDPGRGTGGSMGSGGHAAGGSIGSGGSRATGGSTGLGGNWTGGSGGKATGGTTGSGGKATGGTTGSGGKATGGTTGSGGHATGGTTGSGGHATGGTTGSGGHATGGTTGSGGHATGGSTGLGGASPGTALPDNAKIIYLHHSTGGVIWGEGVPSLVENYNQSNNKHYEITERAFPADSPYGWENYPYDYWNIWVNHAGPQPYMTEPTLEILTQEYNVIVFKHCFPVSNIDSDNGGPDIASNAKTSENYRAQYNALKAKMHAFPSSRFIVWTGAARKQSETSAEEASRARAFFTWVKNVWDEPDDNIFVWDFWQLETDGGLYLLESNATEDSHPSSSFGRYAAPLFVNRLTAVLEGRGDQASLTGQ